MVECSDHDMKLVAIYYIINKENKLAPTKTNSKKQVEKEFINDKENFG